MIARCFDYYRPETLAQTGAALKRVKGKQALFYGGGSEILSMARVGSIAPDAVIDVKSIPELRAHKLERDFLTLGAALTLSEIAERDLFPLLSATARRVADHTNQCRITLGGNIAGTIAYRETALPLLLADATVTFWRDGRAREEPMQTAFDKRIRRAPDELIVCFRVAREHLNLPYVHVKRTVGEKIGYPLVTLAAVRRPDGARLALSGVTAYPFRSAALDDIFAQTGMPAADRAREMMARLPENALDDCMASGPYRAFQTEKAIEAAMMRLEGEMG